MQSAPVGRYRTVARSVRLFRSFLVEQTDPDRFYTDVADDTVALISRHEQLKGRSVLDVGAGQEQFAPRFVERGARYLAVDIERGALRTGPEVGAVVGRGEQLPFADDVGDVGMSNNVMEHVPDRRALLDEMLRVVRPGGLVFVSYTAWYGPWGGHETSPWHLLGGHRARRRYERRHGRPPKNRFGETMYAVTVREGLGLAHRSDVEILQVAPRYFPEWADGLLKVPGLRELVTWNVLLVLRRR